MNYKSFIIGLLIFWLGYYIFMFISVVNIISRVKVTTAYNSEIRTNGAFGVIKHYYIESDSKKESNTEHPTERLYSGFSLSRLLVPKGAINEQKTVTFFALDQENKTAHFAATAGKQPATLLRLCMDVLSYFIIKYGLLHLGLLLLFGFSDNIYAYFTKAKETTSDEIFGANNSPVLKTVLMYLFYVSLIIIFI